MSHVFLEHSVDSGKINLFMQSKVHYRWTDRQTDGKVVSVRSVCYVMLAENSELSRSYVHHTVCFFIAVAVHRVFVCVILAFQTSTAFAVIWFLQGLVQGGSWPACAKIMKQVSFTAQCTAHSYRVCIYVKLCCL